MCIISVHGHNKVSNKITCYERTFVLNEYLSTVGGIRLGYILIISGKTGSELSRVSTPNSTEILFAPQMFVQNGNNSTILFGTGSQNRPGGLYIAFLKDIYNKQMVILLLNNNIIKYFTILFRTQLRFTKILTKGSYLQ